MNNDIIDVSTDDQRAEGLKAWGWLSYVLHLIVALGAVIPGAQPGAPALGDCRLRRAGVGTGPECVLLATQRAAGTFDRRAARQG